MTPTPAEWLARYRTFLLQPYSKPMIYEAEVSELLDQARRILEDGENDRENLHTDAAVID